MTIRLLRMLLATLLALGAFGDVRTVRAQQTVDDVEALRREIQESQLRLEQVREERARLQRDMDGLRSRLQNVSGELENIERQLSASRSVAAEINFQIDLSTAQVQRTTADLLRTREQLSERQAILNRRLRDIYKGGPLHASRVLLGAQSFSNLLNRIRYLQTIASYDRILLDNVRDLERELAEQSRDLQAGLSELGRLRDARQGELAELRQIESEHQRTLQQFRTQERQSITRLDQLDADEAQLAALLATLDQQRLVEERRRTIEGGPTLGGATLTTADIGLLDWPVLGDIAYPFGVERRANGTVLRWNGIGIRAPVGTPVGAVRAGTVLLAGPLEGYGPSVILSHGGGFYTLYLYLEEIGVVEGRDVDAGQVVGTVGGQGTPEGPRLEFQIRAPVGGGTQQQPLDPMRWLRPRAGRE